MKVEQGMRKFVGKGKEIKSLGDELNNIVNILTAWIEKITHKISHYFTNKFILKACVPCIHLLNTDLFLPG